MNVFGQPIHIDIEMRDFRKTPFNIEKIYTSYIFFLLSLPFFIFLKRKKNKGLKEGKVGEGGKKKKHLTIPVPWTRPKQFLFTIHISLFKNVPQQAATKVTNSISLLWQQFLQPLKVAALKAFWRITIDTYTQT